VPHDLDVVSIEAPGHLSYPIGAGAIAATLAGAPHLDASRLSSHSRTLVKKNILPGQKTLLGLRQV
jgi:hypothetical protein